MAKLTDHVKRLLEFNDEEDTRCSGGRCHQDYETGTMNYCKKHDPEEFVASHKWSAYPHDENGLHNGIPCEFTKKESVSESSDERRSNFAGRGLDLVDKINDLIEDWDDARITLLMLAQDCEKEGDREAGEEVRRHVRSMQQYEDQLKAMTKFLDNIL